MRSSPVRSVRRVDPTPECRGGGHLDPSGRRTGKPSIRGAFLGDPANGTNTGPLSCAWIRRRQGRSHLSDELGYLPGEDVHHELMIREIYRGWSIAIRNSLR